MLKGVSVNIVPDLNSIIVINNSIAIGDMINNGVFVDDINLGNASGREKQKSKYEETKEVFSHRRKVIHQYTKLKTSLEYKRKRQSDGLPLVLREGKYS